MRKQRIIFAIISLAIGYFFGSYLTAEAVAKKETGKSAEEIGTSHNPGMANIMAHVGFVPGLKVLAGDLGKVILSAFICMVMFGNVLGSTAILLAGTGATIGHDFSMWHRGHGGKGVATTCITVFLFSPLLGLSANIAGMLTVFGTQYLCTGAVVIPLVFTAIAFPVYGPLAGCCGLLLSLLALWKNRNSLRQIREGTCERVDVPAAIRKKFLKVKSIFVFNNSHDKIVHSLRRRN